MNDQRILVTGALGQIGTELSRALRMRFGESNVLAMSRRSVPHNLAYVFDDALIVGIAIYTLNRQKLQEKRGRWLKLASGVVIIVLGLMLLFAPEHLLLTL